MTSLFRFSATVELSELSSLLNALVCHAQWDSPAVLAEKNLLLKSDQKAAAHYVHCWCAWAQKCMNECFQHLQWIKKNYFAIKFYFYCLNQDIDGQNLPEDLTETDTLKDESSMKKDNLL